MIWVLFAIAAGIAIWAAAATRSGAIQRQLGQPVAWGTGVTAVLLLALGIYSEVQAQRMANEIMRQIDDGQEMFDRDLSKPSALRRELKESGDALDRMRARMNGIDVPEFDPLSESQGEAPADSVSPKDRRPSSTSAPAAPDRP